MASEGKGGDVAAADHRHAEHDHRGDVAGHDHDHGGAGHVHAPASFGKAFAIGIALNTALVMAEAVYGYLGNSTALMADAGHNLSDVFGLMVAWGASVVSNQPPSGRFTYGLRDLRFLQRSRTRSSCWLRPVRSGGNRSSASRIPNRSPA